MKKTDLIQKLKNLETITQDERAFLINLVNTKKKYGLVWEDKPEDVEEQLRESLPVLKEVKDKAIVNGEECPNHVLIEGDNLHALTALTFTHEGKVDVIYIDPPYNTGNKDFKYNDTFVDKEDSFRHSKWLSFMNKRLEIAKRLLSEKGVIFISIDDNEEAQLKILCDEIFGELNMVATIVWEKIHSTKNDAKFLSNNHEYLLLYSKNIENISIKLLGRTDEMNARYKNPDNDPRGPWQSGDLVANEVRKEGNYDVINPKTGKVFNVPAGKHWVYSKENMLTYIQENRIWFGKDGDAFPRKKRFLKEVTDRKASTLWTSDEVGHNQEAKRELKDIFEQSEQLFSTPKPIRLLERILDLSSEANSIILDFFAGSGTTLNATIKKNSEDNGKRQCLIVTNNENNICEEVTYERNKRVIQGYSNAKGEKIQGVLQNNLRYYKSEFVSREPSVKNKKELTKLATELLCIKEDVYAENKTIGEYKLNGRYTRCFEKDKLYLLIIYEEEVIEQIVEVIKATINKSKGRKPRFKIYVFSNGQYPYTEEFEEVLEHITLCALPEVIYKAYQNVLPKRQRKLLPELEETTAEDVESILLKEENNDLFNQEN
jgi:adenine-specific DNA-methyltransferase